ncbi:MAG: ATP-binding protein [Janthinobacterium lividum]
MTDQLTQLRVGDENFLVSSMIERCPKIMMLRELVRNALEAAATAPEGCRQVRLSAVMIGGVPKLAIWNSGRGMDAGELFRMCDIASSVRKEHRLDQNFGMGAKVASLPSNRHGLRYRSCHAGVVHEVMLGWRDGVYGRLRRVDADGTMQDVLMVSADAAAQGHALDQDWTEVVLFGNSAAQDTVRDPYQGAPQMTPNWLAEELGYKFFRIDSDIDVRLEQHGRPFEPLALRIPRDYSRHSSVTLPDGMVLHYVYDAPGDDDVTRGRAGRDALNPMPGTCGLIYRDELYDVQREQHWLHAAPVFGVPFGARSISVFIELPERIGIVPDGYRQFLRYAGGNQGQVACRQFARAVHQHRPGWLVDIIDTHSPSARVSSDVYDDLDHLLRTLKVRRRRRVIPNAARPIDVETTGTGPAVPVADARAGSRSAGIGRMAHGHLHVDHDPNADETFDVEPSPEILILRDPLEIDARGLIERAGRYYPETHQLFLNGTYPAVTEMRRLLEQECAAEVDQETVRHQALHLAERSLAARVGRMLVFALSKQGKWSDQDVNQACSPHALSLVADDVTSSLPAARASMQGMLDLRRIVAEPA